MGPLDKKQKIQVAILGVLACCLFGWFTYKMMLPSPAAAQSHASLPPSGQVAAQPAGKKGSAASTSETDAASAALPVPPPTPDMQDPFIPGIADPGAVSAYLLAQKQAKLTANLAPRPGQSEAAISVPQVSPLPSPGDETSFSKPAIQENSGGGLVMPLPVIPSTPNWSVTGVLQSDNAAVAILRSGDARRIVHVGDLVDSQFRMVRVTRTAVILRHGDKEFPLPLGGAPDTTKEKKALTQTESNSTSSSQDAVQAKTKNILKSGFSRTGGTGE